MPDRTFEKHMIFMSGRTLALVTIALTLIVLTFAVNMIVILKVNAKVNQVESIVAGISGKPVVQSAGRVLGLFDSGGEYTSD